MKLISILYQVIVNTFFTSATPNLFGSKRRIQDKRILTDRYQARADDTQAEMDALAVENPFESAAAKSAMATSMRKANQTRQRFANIMGGNTNPEANIAGQQVANEAVASTAGDIAVGSEAQKRAEMSQLRGLKEQQLNTAGALNQAAINEYGSGWRDFFATRTAKMGGGALKGGSSAAAQ